MNIQTEVIQRISSVIYKRPTNREGRLSIRRHKYICVETFGVLSGIEV